MDIWSLGVLLFAIVSGEELFYADNSSDLLSKIINEPMDIMSDTRLQSNSQELRGLLNGML